MRQILRLLPKVSEGGRVRISFQCRVVKYKADSIRASSQRTRLSFSMITSTGGEEREGYGHKIPLQFCHDKEIRSISL